MIPRMRFSSFNVLAGRRPTSRAAKSLGPLELELLQEIWAGGEMSVRDVHRRHTGGLAYTTLMTTLDRLYKKGFLERKKSGRAFLYSPAMSRAQFAAMVAQQAAESMITFAEPDAAAVLSHFVDAMG